jgi:hypothetical protein
MLLSDKIPLQGNVKNYLGKQKTVKAPLHWKSAPDHPKTKLAYITDKEEKILVDLNLYNSMDGKPNTGPHGIPSLNGGGGGSEGAGSDSGSDSGGDSGGNATDTGDMGSEAANDAASASAEAGGSESSDSNDGGYGGFDGTESANDGGFGSTENNSNDGFDGTESLNDQGWGSTENDFNTGAYDYESAAYGPGKITSTSLTPSSFFGYGEVTINQTPGVISANEYGKATINELMSNPTVKEADKVDLLNRMQAAVNSNLTGAKLSNVKDAEAALFAVDLLSNALVDVKSNPAYDDLTSKIDETAVTFGQTFKDDPLGTLFKNGLTGTVMRSAYDAYKNNNALSFMGFTGQIMNKRGYDPNDPSYDPYTSTTSNVGEGGDSESNLGKLILQTGAFQPYTGPSAAIGFFAKNPYNVQTLYNNAKQKITGILQASPSPYGLNAISDSPFYDYLKKFNLNKGIL